MPSLPSSLLKRSPRPLLSERAQGGGEHVLTGTSGSPTRTSASVCPCRGLPLAMAQAGGCLAGEQLCGKGLGGQGAGQEAATCPGSKGGQQGPGLYDQEHGQEMEGRDSPPLRGTC